MKSLNTTILVAAIVTGALLLSPGTAQTCNADNHFKANYAEDGYNVRAFDFDANSESYVVVGGDKVSTATSASEAYIYLIKTDDCTLQWSHALERFEQFTFVTFKREDSKDVYAVAQRVTDDAGVTTPTYVQNIVMKFKKEGGIEWYRLMQNLPTGGETFENNIFDGIFLD